jgi:hypothetical protein
MEKTTFSFVMPVCPFALNYSASNGRIFMKFDIWALKQSFEKIQSY